MAFYLSLVGVAKVCCSTTKLSFHITLIYFCQLFSIFACLTEWDAFINTRRSFKHTFYNNLLVQIFNMTSRWTSFKGWNSCRKCFWFFYKPNEKNRRNKPNQFYWNDFLIKFNRFVYNQIQYLNAKISKTINQQLRRLRFKCCVFIGLHWMKAAISITIWRYVENKAKDKQVAENKSTNSPNGCRHFCLYLVLFVHATDTQWSGKKGIRPKCININKSILNSARVPISQSLTRPANSLNIVCKLINIFRMCIELWKKNQCRIRNIHTFVEMWVNIETIGKTMGCRESRLVLTMDEASKNQNSIWIKR